ncbi:hypothetical protein Pogu_1570 [Pyrobaculum oguniense TE7]|uniref:Uncharacterized protein n=1 Tax=Pyrobaculum oguniense (strain DSM 13380 / JCM 10595 / TE7) TaxID=698757 RepID=H6Q968_PYROT|nr:hypothetical protein Pogu_1570 [Pyrobaculum oguniense TE7]
MVSTTHPKGSHKSGFPLQKYAGCELGSGPSRYVIYFLSDEIIDIYNNLYLPFW